MKKKIAFVLAAVLGFTLFSCSAPAVQEAETIQAKTASTASSEEQERCLILFSNMRIRDTQALQSFFNAVEDLRRDSELHARMYLAGCGDVLLSDCYISSYHAFVETFSPETMQEILGNTLCEAFSREGMARRAFIDQVRSNTLAPSLVDPDSEFHTLMDEVYHAYKEILPFSVYLIRIRQAEAEEAQYFHALENFSSLLEEATALLQADENKTGGIH